MGGDESKDIKTIYDEVCRRHDGIADFRAKLPTLLPIASGAGIFLLVAKDAIAPTALPHLLPVGTFGVLVTLGLFCYELRGIQECNALIRAAQKLEEKLLPELWHFGAFNFKPHALLHGTVGATGAALVIYPAVVGAWVYVAAVGAVGTLDPKPQVPITAVAGGCAALLLGLVVNQRQRKLLDDSEKRATTAMKVKELIALLKADGWFQVCTKGNHRQFHHRNKPGTVTVSGKPNVDIPAGTLNSALKQAGLKKPE